MLLVMPVTSSLELPWGEAPDEHEITRILDNHGVHGAVDPADLMRQAAAFVTWMHETWPSATADIESSGTMLRDGQVISARMNSAVHVRSIHGNDCRLVYVQDRQ